MHMHMLTARRPRSPGCSTLFKAMAVACGSQPSGADKSLLVWLLWFTSLPEPSFAKGKLMRVGQAERARRAALLLLKLLGLAALVSVLHNLDGYTPFGGAPTAGGWLGGGGAHLANAMAHLWLLYLWASFCLDVGSLLVMGLGLTTEPAFRNPLLGSRSVREAWGERWNRPVHTFLKRSVYIPARKLGIPPPLAAVLAFAASGLLHEYNFAVHNAAGWVPGHALLFFLLMGGLMLAEDRAASALTAACPAIRRAASAAPTVLVSISLQLVVLPAFSALFMPSWLESGMIEAVAEMVPHVRCT